MKRSFVSYNGSMSSVRTVTSLSLRKPARGLHAALITALLWGCSPAAAPAPVGPETPTPPPSAVDAAANEDAAYATAPPDQRQPPPPAGPSPEWHFPAVIDQTLPNGLAVKLVSRSTIPLIDLQVVLRSGQATDNGKAGLAVISGEMLKVGGTGKWTSRELLERVEALGSHLEIVTQRDSTTISLSVTANQFDEAMKLLSSIVLEPAFNVTEFNKLKRREMDRVESAARSDAAWATNMVLYQKLFGSAGPHPYATYDATATQIDKITLVDAKKWYGQHFVPPNAALVVAGAVEPAVLSKAAATYFGKWRGIAPKPLAVPAVELKPGLQIFLVDRPKSPQAELVLASLGPTRKSDTYATVKVANQVLGGGVAGRLFQDVREQRSLAYSTYSSVDEVVNGPEPLLLRAGTQTAKAGLTLQALLEHALKIGATPLTDGELESARRYLTDVFLLRTETVGALGQMAGSLWLHGLPNQYFETYRDLVRKTDIAQVQTTASQYFTPTRSIAVVAGDAARLADPLSHFGEVIVLDPDKGFEQRKVVPQNPSAPIELNRVDGT
jgi:predicted Zn-dependent peptidase